MSKYLRLHWMKLSYVSVIDLKADTWQRVSKFTGSIEVLLASRLFSYYPQLYGVRKQRFAAVAIRAGVRSIGQFARSYKRGLRW